MQISDTEVKKALSAKPNTLETIHLPTHAVVSVPVVDEARLIDSLTKEVVAMPDREDRIEELRAQIAAGTYNPTSEQIVDAMARRTLADRIAKLHS